MPAKTNSICFLAIFFYNRNIGSSLDTTILQVESINIGIKHMVNFIECGFLDDGVILAIMLHKYPN